MSVTDNDSEEMQIPHLKSDCSFSRREDLMELANGTIEEIYGMGYADEEYGYDWREVNTGADGSRKVSAGHHKQYVPPTTLSITINGMTCLREASFWNACALVREKTDACGPGRVLLYTDNHSEPLNVDPNGCAINVSRNPVFFIKVGTQLFSFSTKEDYAFFNGNPIGASLSLLPPGADVIVGGSVKVSITAPNAVVIE